MYHQFRVLPFETYCGHTEWPPNSFIIKCFSRRCKNDYSPIDETNSTPSNLPLRRLQLFIITLIVKSRTAFCSRPLYIVDWDPRNRWFPICFGLCGLTEAEGSGDAPTSTSPERSLEPFWTVLIEASPFNYEYFVRGISPTSRLSWRLTLRGLIKYIQFWWLFSDAISRKT